MLKGVVSAGTRGINIHIDEGNSSYLFLCVSRDYTRPPHPLMATLQFFLFLMVGFRTDCCELLSSFYIIEKYPGYRSLSTFETIYGDALVSKP